MDEFDSYCRRILVYSAMAGAAGAAMAFAIFHRGNPGVFAGFCLGGAFSMLRWRLMMRELKRFAGGGSGVGRWLRMFFVRYALTGAVITLGIASPAFSAAATVAGLFLVNAVVVGEQVADALRRGAGGT